MRVSRENVAESTCNVLTDGSTDGLTDGPTDGPTDGSTDGPPMDRVMEHMYFH